MVDDLVQLFVKDHGPFPFRPRKPDAFGKGMFVVFVAALLFVHYAGHVGENVIFGKPHHVVS